MNKMNRLIADLIEAATGQKADDEVLYFNYKNRNFRVLIHGDLNQLEVDDGNFDRWANSRGAFVCPCPLTESSMKKAIDFLLDVNTL